MHAYGDKGIVEAKDDGGLDAASSGMPGSGLLFEEAGGLPIFFQVTSSSLPLLSDDKRDALSHPALLGPTLLGPCVSLLEFVLRRERLQRPSLAQVQVKFRDTVRDVVRLALHMVKPKLPEVALQLRAHHKRKSHVPAPSHALAAAPSSSATDSSDSGSSPDACWCNPLPFGWRGEVPLVRCARCTLSKPGASAPTSDSLRTLCARRPSSIQLHVKSVPLVSFHWRKQEPSVRLLGSAETGWLEHSGSASGSAAAPLLFAWDEDMLASLDLAPLRRRTVFFVHFRMAASGGEDAPAAGESMLQLQQDGAFSTAFVPTAELEAARAFFSQRAEGEVLGRSESAAPLLALLRDLLLASPLGSTAAAIAADASLRCATSALLAL